MSCKPTCTLTRTVENHIGDNRWRDRPSLVRLRIESRWVDQDLDRGASLFVSIPRSAALPHAPRLAGPTIAEAVEHGLVPKVWPGSTVLSHFATRAISSINGWSHNFKPSFAAARRTSHPTVVILITVLANKGVSIMSWHTRAKIPNNPVMSVMAITQPLHSPREGDHEE